jgi:hypothetical protein
MGAESDRLERAGRYVLGLMETAERERAERDLEFDAKFRAAVVAVAERMHLFDLGPSAGKPEADWDAIAGRIAAMPHMNGSRKVVEQAATLAKPAGKPTRDTMRRNHGSAEEDANPRISASPFMLAAMVAAAFAAGYAAGIWTGAP